MRAEDLLNAWDQGLDQPLPVEQPKTPKTAEELLDDWDAENAGFLSGIKDIGASVVASLPATAQGIVDVGRMVTGDPVWMENLSEWIGNKTESLKNATLSDAALAQQRRIQRGLNDPAFKASDLHQLLSDNPLGALTMAGESVGTMVVPIGAGGAAARGVSWASQLAKAGRGGSVARILGGVNPTVAATVGANTGNAALNAADTFTSHEMDGKPMSDRYTGAGVSGLVSLAAGKLTGGGAEGIVARRLAQDIGKNAANNAVARVLGQVAIGGAKEGLQEGIEESGNVLGEHVGANTPVDLNQDAKRVGLSAALGALIGGPVSGISAYSERGGNQPVAANTPTPTQTQAPAQTSEADAKAAIDALSKLAQTLSNTKQVPAQAQTQVQSPAPTPISAPAPSQPPVQVASQTEAPEQIRIMPQDQNRATDTADRSPVLQNRDRSNKASIEQMNRIAGNPDYGRVGVGRDFANGAPVVAYGNVPDEQKGRVDYATTHTGERIPIQYAVVEADTVATSHTDMGNANPDYGSTDRVTAIAGNGRIAGITAAYRRGTTNTYREEMTADSDMHGVNPQVIARMKNPVLVRIMPNERVTGNIGDISNTTGNQSLNAVEKAHNDANRVNFESLEFNEDGSPTADTVAGFVSGMPSSERAELVDSHGRANSQAIDRLNNAIFAAAYGNDDLIAMYAMAVDPDAKLVINTLAQLAPKLYRLEGCGELDFRDVLVQAVNQIVEGKRRGLKMQDIVKQTDAFADPDIALFLDLFAQNPRSNKQVIAVLSDAADFAYNEATRDTETADMFGEVQPVSRADLMQHIRQTNDQITELRNAQRQAKRSQAANIQNSAGSVRSGQNAPRGNAGTNPSTDDAGRLGNAQGNESFSLQGQTQEEVEAEALAREQAEAEQARLDAADQRQRDAQNLRNEVRSLNDSYADNFSLTDDTVSAEDALTGQEGFKFSRAWHGSGARFDQFSTNYIGTGTGRSTYGWGLYFTSDRKVAEAYRDKLNADGSLFEVEVPEDSELLDADKPYSEQPPEVKAAIDRLFTEEYGRPVPPAHWTGRQVYQEVILQEEGLVDDIPPDYEVLWEMDELAGNQRLASEKLNSIGVKGVRFEGEDNDTGYVVFDDKAIEVIENHTRNVNESDGYAQSRTQQQQKGSTIDEVNDILGNDADIGETFNTLVKRQSVVVVQSENDIPGFSMTSRSPMKSVEANIKRGKEAMAKALSEKTSVHRAMFRTGMGWVDFVWGDEGGTVRNDGRRPGEKGIAHIIEARMRKDNLSKPEVFNLLNRPKLPVK